MTNKSLKAGIRWSEGNIFLLKVTSFKQLTEVQISRGSIQPVQTDSENQ